MSRGRWIRFLMVTTGLGMFVFYAVAAYLAYGGLLYLWRQRPDPTTTVVVVVTAALAFGYVSYQFGTARILRSLEAQEIETHRAPEFYRRVDELAASVGVDRPRVLVAHMEMPNALALGGPTDGELVLDARLFRLLSARELEAIVAHELAHLENRDGLVQTVGYSLVQTVTGLLLLALFPITLLVAGSVRALGYVRGDSFQEIKQSTRRARLAVTSLSVVLLFVFTLALRAHSRRRELAADDRAAEVTGQPRALASALQKIERAATPTGPLSSLYIHGDEEGPLTRLLATHPPMETRVERLEAQADERTTRIPIR